MLIVACLVHAEPMPSAALPEIVAVVVKVCCETRWVDSFVVELWLGPLMPWFVQES